MAKTENIFGELSGGGATIKGHYFWSRMASSIGPVLIFETADINHVKSALESGTANANDKWGYTNTLQATYWGSGLSNTASMNGADFDVDKNYTYLVATWYSSSGGSGGYYSYEVS